MSRRRKKNPRAVDRKSGSSGGERRAWASARRRDGQETPAVATPLYRGDPEETLFFQSRWKPLVVALGLAFVYRLVYFFAARATDPAFGQALPGLDTATYHEWAQKILEGDLTSSHTRVFYYGPVYPYVLAAVYKIAGVRPLAGVAFNMLLGLSMVALVQGAMQQWFSRRVAFAASLGVGLCPGVLFFEAALLPAVVAFVGLSAFLLFLGLAQNHATPRRGEEPPGVASGWWMWTLAGFCLGLASVQRANSLLCVGGVGVWIVLYFRGRFGWRRQAAWFLLFLAGVIVPLVPTTLHNRVYGNQWVLVTSNGPTLLYIGNTPDGTGTFAYSPSYLELRERKEGGAKIAWTKELLRDIARHPVAWAGVMARKAYMFWAAFDVPDNFSYDLSRRFNPALRFGPFGFALLAPLGLVGMALAARRWRRVLALYLFVLSFWASLVIVFIVGRYRIPVVVAVSGFAGLTFWQGWNWWLGRRFGRFAALAGAVVALAAVLLAWRQLPFGGVRVNDFKNVALYSLREGDAAGAARTMAEGEAYFLEQEPPAGRDRELYEIHLGEIRTQRAAVLMRIERWAEAEAVLGKMLRERQAGVQEVEMLKDALIMQGKYSEARELLRRVVDLYPDEEDLRRQLRKLDAFLMKQGE